MELSIAAWMSYVRILHLVIAHTSRFHREPLIAAGSDTGRRPPRGIDGTSTAAM